MRPALILLLAAASLALAQEQQLPWWWNLSAPEDTPPPANNNNNQPPTNNNNPAGGVGSSTPDPISVSSYQPCECGPGRSCVCVIYYQCVNDTIVTTGAGILEDRVNVPKVERCPGVQLCCQEPKRRPAGGDTATPPATPTTPPTPATPPYVEPATPTPSPVTPAPQPGGEVPPRPAKSGCGVRRGQSPPADNSTAFAEFPWMLAVQKANYPGDGKPPAFVFQCGGSLIHPQVALTAAHCVKRTIPSDVRVRAGIWDLTATTEPLPHQERRVIKIIMHPQFEEKTLFNDIALLVLDKTFDEALNVDIMCLPPPSVQFTGLRCIATGWGTSSPGSEVIQTTMKKVELPIVPRDRCENALRMTRLGLYFELHESFMCAGGEPNVDTCRGSLLHNTGCTEAVTGEQAFIRKNLQEKDDSGKFQTDDHNLFDDAYHAGSLYGSGTHKRHAVSLKESIPNYGNPQTQTQFLKSLEINPNTPGLQWLSQFLQLGQQANPGTNKHNLFFPSWNPFVLQGTQSENHPNPLTPGKFPYKNTDKQYDNKGSPHDSTVNSQSSGGALYSHKRNPNINVGNLYNGYNVPGSNANSRNPYASDNQQAYGSNNHNFPGPNHNFPGPNHNFPGPNQNFPDPNQNFPDPNQNFPGPNQNFPSPNQNFPGPNQNFPGPNQNFPGPNQNFPGPNQNFPGPNQNFPGPNQNFPGPNQNFPGPNQNFHGPNLNFPGPNLNFPGPNQNFPGPNQNFPGPNHNFPGPNHNFPGPNHNFPGPNHNFPGPNHNFPGPNQNFPGPNQNFPGPNQNFPGPNQNFPGPNQNFPGPNQKFPGPNQKFPGPNQNFPGPNQNFPGPNQNFPGPNQNFPGPNQNEENAHKDELKNPWLPFDIGGVKRPQTTGGGHFLPQEENAHKDELKNTWLPFDIGGVKRPQTTGGGHFLPQDSKVCPAAVTPIDGDGGGPLVCPISGDDGRYIQVGIVSWGIGCGDNRTPAVYASLSYFRNWVEQQLKDNLFKNIANPPPSVEEDQRVKVPTPTWG